jgi:hypothetical protein
MITTYTIGSCICGYHVYKDIWSASPGDILVAMPKLVWKHVDPYAVAVVVVQAALLKSAIWNSAAS